jgi:hypothetical protein
MSVLFRVFLGAHRGVALPNRSSANTPYDRAFPDTKMIELKES